VRVKVRRDQEEECREHKGWLRWLPAAERRSRPAQIILSGSLGRDCKAGSGGYQQQSGGYGGGHGGGQGGGGGYPDQGTHLSPWKKQQSANTFQAKTATARAAATRAASRAVVMVVAAAGKEPPVPTHHT
jgi:hypothetical protein